MKKLATMEFKENEFQSFIKMQIQIALGKIPKDSICVKHSVGTDDLSKGGFHSWTEYWNEKSNGKPINPNGSVCPCCNRKILESESNYFVIAHIEDINTHKMYLHPVCNDCNTKMKKWRFFAKRDRLLEAPTDL